MLTVFVAVFFAVDVFALAPVVDAEDFAAAVLAAVVFAAVVLAAVALVAAFVDAVRAAAALTAVVFSAVSAAVFFAAADFAAALVAAAFFAAAVLDAVLLLDAVAAFEVVPPFDVVPVFDVVPAFDVAPVFDAVPVFAVAGAFDAAAVFDAVAVLVAVLRETVVFDVGEPVAVFFAAVFRGAAFLTAGLSSAVDDTFVSEAESVASDVFFAAAAPRFVFGVAAVSAPALAVGTPSVRSSCVSPDAVTPTKVPIRPDRAADPVTTCFGAAEPLDAAHGS
ncbi:hypothetical protein [Microbacterium esteraromaticum]|uniref:hypothetical protein n=1 Tax=Microbacterium esteraromaticum TaxID=57043 RepID=UPI0019D34780|nr:hypothetical protein [Microbacterium esteraromaticum]MBN7794890.1 hypothetical protein [Microbacterium esteraromaticum]